MSLLDRVKRLFSKNPLPEETMLLINGVHDVNELRSGLDEIATRNEVEAREIERVEFGVTKQFRDFTLNDT